jgi:hypothetical protein
MKKRLAVASAIAVLAAIVGGAFWSTYGRPASAGSRAHSSAGGGSPTGADETAIDQGARLGTSPSQSTGRARMDRGAADEMRQRLQALLAQPGGGWSPSEDAAAPVTGR